MILRHKALRVVLPVLGAVLVVAVLLAGVAFEVRTLHASGTGGGGGGPFPQQSSPYWAGYVASGSSAGHAVHSRVTVPTVTCTANSYVAAWVGFGGAASNDTTVVQNGFQAACAHAGATPEYSLWWEFYPHTQNSGDKQLEQLASRLRPGYTVDLYVDSPVLACNVPLRNGGCIHWGNGAYFSFIVNDSSGAYIGNWSATEAFPLKYNPIFGSNECIVEAPYNASAHRYPPLVQFSPVKFKDCSVFSSGHPVTEWDMSRNGQLWAVPDITSPYSDPADITEFQVYWIGNA